MDCSGGTTVHGVAVIGVGIAGGVRIRDIQAITSHGDIHWALKGFVSRRTLEIDAEQLSMDEVLTRTDIDTMIICTENNTHEKFVREGLEHNKHVLVEFPLALSSSIATELYTLAENKGLILHEENIGLLNDYKEQLEESPVRWKAAEITLTSGFKSSGVEDKTKAAVPFIANVSLIENIYHLCGNVKVIGGNYTKSDRGFKAVATLETDDSRSVTVTIEREEDKKRSKTIKFVLEDGNELVLSPKPHATNSKVGLFMQDFLIFMEKVHNKQNNEADITRTLRSLEIAEDIHRHILK